MNGIIIVIAVVRDRCLARREMPIALLNKCVKRADFEKPIDPRIGITLHSCEISFNRQCTHRGETHAHGLSVHPRNFPNSSPNKEPPNRVRPDVYYARLLFLLNRMTIRSRQRWNV